MAIHSRQIRHTGSSLRLLSGAMIKLRHILRWLCYLWGMAEASGCCRLTQQSSWRLSVAWSRWLWIVQLQASYLRRGQKLHMPIGKPTGCELG